jgi:tetratricopeptide (TPR) repeat protein
LPLGKALFSALLVCLVAQAAPLGAVLLMLLATGVLWRWPRVRWPLFMAVLVATALVTSICGRGPSRPVTQQPATVPARTAAPVAAPSAAQATATAITRNASSSYNQGRQHWLAHEFEAAVADLSRAVELRPAWSSAYNLRALALVGAGQYDQALRDADTAVGQLRSANFLDTRAYVHLKRGEYDLAQSDYDEVFKLTASPGAASYLGRGLVREGLGDTSGAKADLEVGLQLSPQAPVDPQRVDLETEARRVLGRPAPQASPSPAVSVIDWTGRSSKQRVKRLDPAPKRSRGAPDAMPEL